MTINDKAEGVIKQRLSGQMIKEVIGDFKQREDAVRIAEMEKYR